MCIRDSNYPVTALCLMLVMVIVLDYPILLFPAVNQALKYKPLAGMQYSRHMWSVLFTVVILAVVMLIPDLEDVFGLGGSLGISIHCYVVPGLILFKTQHTIGGRLLGGAIAMLGTSILVVSTFFILAK
eukprot:TRINITY_DN11961_c0_g1_i3.p2 TRINITY_DN11961_c0_g1~~TRINITY_DN11961_c0_g1_i3.p2  ORF type:complete len:129 (-),score=41.88 TRINITY_DN11961_c0_g1_i3:396-782(-)